jgi:pilus assembly protein Flp/PilA
MLPSGHLAPKRLGLPTGHPEQGAGPNKSGNVRTEKRDVAMRNLFKKFIGDKSGASAAEYGLILALVGIAIVGGVTLVGQELDATFSDAAGEIAKR